MTATAAQIARLRRMVAEPTNTTYSDLVLTEIIGRYPLIDDNGEFPLVIDTTTGIATANTDWTETYDLNAAAAEIWDEKAGTAAEKFDYSAEGSDFRLSQIAKEYTNMAETYRKRKSRRVQTVFNFPEEEIEVEE